MFSHIDGSAAAWRKEVAAVRSDLDLLQYGERMRTKPHGKPVATRNAASSQWRKS